MSKKIKSPKPMRDFVCPQCGGSAFGRDVAERDGKVVVLPTVRCHSCGWHGEWSAKQP